MGDEKYHHIAHLLFVNKGKRREFGTKRVSGERKKSGKWKRKKMWDIASMCVDARY